MQLFASRGSQIFTSNGTFTVPASTSSVQVHVVAIGGGGGGTNGHQAGGGGGYVACGTFNASGGTTIAVTVGAGGSGAEAQFSSNYIAGNTDGVASTFGQMLAAPGGTTITNVPGTVPGAAGGSGSGSPCWGCGAAAADQVAAGGRVAAPRAALVEPDRAQPHMQRAYKWRRSTNSLPESAASVVLLAATTCRAAAAAGSSSTATGHLLATVRVDLKINCNCLKYCK